MLVIFKSEAYGNITMFANVAQQLLHLMGYEKTPTGVIAAQDVPRALELLKNASKVQKDVPLNNEHQTQSHSEPETVNLSQRAFPLIEMLTAAEKEKCYVLWETK